MFNYFPVGIDHRFEIGVGASATYVSSLQDRFKFEPFTDYIDTKSWLFLPAGSLAYRYQPRAKRWWLFLSCRCNIRKLLWDTAADIFRIYMVEVYQVSASFAHVGNFT